MKNSFYYSIETRSPILLPTITERAVPQNLVISLKNCVERFYQKYQKDQVNQSQKKSTYIEDTVEKVGQVNGTEKKDTHAKRKHKDYKIK